MKTNLSTSGTLLTWLIGIFSLMAAPLRAQQVVGWGSNTSGQATIPSGLSEVMAIAAGGEHSLAVDIDGTVSAWGRNDAGQATVPAGLTEVEAIAAGGSHSLVLMADGTVSAWGKDFSTWGDVYYGQATVPAGLSGVVAIAAGKNHSLALKSDGTVAGWGWDNDFEPIMVPSGLFGVVNIAAGDSHSLALKADGTVVAWGDDSQGQTTVPQGLLGVVAIAAGKENSMALKMDGTVAVWGSNMSGQTNVPQGLSGVVAIATQGGNMLALKKDGTITTWGYSPYGKIVFPPSITGAATISAGPTHMLALSNKPNFPPLITSPRFARGAPATAGLTGEPFFYRITATGKPGLFGASVLPSGLVFDTATGVISGTPTASGEFNITVSATNSAGTGSAILKLFVIGLPVQGSHPKPRVIALNSLASLGNTVANGPISAWAASGLPPGLSIDATTGTIYGRATQVGSHSITVTVTNVLGSTTTNQTLAIQSIFAWGNDDDLQTTLPVGLSSAQMVAAGSYHTMALRADGTVTAWGLNNFGQTTIPQGLSGVVAVAAGRDQSLALKADGTVSAWGDSSSGKLSMPVDLSGVVAIAAGYNYSLTLNGNGTVSTWGGTRVPTGLAGVVAIAAGGFHALALKAEGTVVAWGGTNGFEQNNVPAGLDDVVAIAAGDYHSLALKSDGTVMAWGHNAYGQTTVPAGLSGVVAIEAGTYHSLALKADGSICTWGTDYYESSIPAGLPRVVSIATGTENNFTILSEVITLPPPPASIAGVPFSYQTGYVIPKQPGSTLRQPFPFVATGLPPGLHYDGATGVLSGTPTQSGTYSIQLQRNGANIGSPIVIAFLLPGAIQTTYDAWRDANWAAGAPFSGFLDDADGDGQRNLIEFAQGTDPHAPNARATQTQHFPGGQLAMTLDLLPSAVENLIVKAQFSSDLSFGGETLEAGPSQREPLASGLTRYHFISPTFAGGRGFGRIVIVAP